MKILCDVVASPNCSWKVTCLKKGVGGIAGGTFISTKIVIMQLLKANIFCFALSRYSFRFILLSSLTFWFSNAILKCFLLIYSLFIFIDFFYSLAVSVFAI